MRTPLKTRSPFLYLERGSLRTQGKSLVFESSDEVVDLPEGKFCCLLLGPGSSVTHEGVKVAAKQGILLQWVGEEGSAIYSAGEPLAGDDARLRAQAFAANDSRARAKVVRWMFNQRFGSKPALSVSEDQIRGMEGSRVRAIYKELSDQHKVPWLGRTTGPGADPINKAISIANGLLTHAATVSVLAAGFSPAIGFLHAGFARAFSCDIADLHKFSVSVPLAFNLVSEERSTYSDIRRGMRDVIAKENLIDKMIAESAEAVNAGFHSS